MRIASVLFCLLVFAAPLLAKDAAPSPPVAFKPSRNWQPGLTKDYPSIGAPECTLDIWIPPTYTNDTKRHFPIVYISGPGGNPGLFGLENWADRNGVILLTINASKNSIDISHIQAVALLTAETEFKLSSYLRFGMGTSGAAMASMDIAINNPDKHAGVLLMAHCGNGLVPLAPKHVCLAFVHGDKDTVQPPAGVIAAYKQAKSRGNPARILTVAGRGHENATTAECEMMLDWMMASARENHPKRPPAEVHEYLEELKQRVEKIAALPPGGPRLVEINAMLDVPNMEKKAEVQPLLKTWFEDTLAAAQGQQEPLPHYELLMQLGESARGKLTPGFSKEKESVRSELLSLRGKQPIKDEYDAQRAWDYCANLEAQAKNKAAMTTAMQAYDAVAKRYPNTKAGKAAGEALERLKNNKG
jgi:hypothetical protein